MPNTQLLIYPKFAIYCSNLKPQSAIVADFYIVIHRVELTLRLEFDDSKKKTLFAAFQFTFLSFDPI